MFGAGEAVGHHGGEQSINATEHAQHSTIDKHQAQLPTGKRGHVQGWQLRRERRNGFQISLLKQRERQHRAQHQSEKLGRTELLDAVGGEPEDRHGD